MTALEAADRLAEAFDKWERDQGGSFNSVKVAVGHYYLARAVPVPIIAERIVPCDHDAEIERLRVELREVTDDRDSWQQQADDRVTGELAALKQAGIQRDEAERLRAALDAVRVLSEGGEGYCWCASCTADQRDDWCEALMGAVAALTPAPCENDSGGEGGES